MERQTPAPIPVTPAGKPLRSTRRRWTIRLLLVLLFVWQIAVTILFTDLVRPAPGAAPVPGASAAQAAGIALLFALGVWAVGSIGIVAIIFRIGKAKA